MTQEGDFLYRVPTDCSVGGFLLLAAFGAPLTGFEPIRSNTHRRPGRYPALGTGFDPPCEDIQCADDVGVVSIPALDTGKFGL